MAFMPSQYHAAPTREIGETGAYIVLLPYPSSPSSSYPSFMFCSFIIPTHPSFIVFTHCLHRYDKVSKSRAAFLKKRRANENSAKGSGRARREKAARLVAETNSPDRAGGAGGRSSANGGEAGEAGAEATEMGGEGTSKVHEISDQSETRV